MVQPGGEQGWLTPLQQWEAISSKKLNPGLFSQTRAVSQVEQGVGCLSS